MNDGSDRLVWAPRAAGQRLDGAWWPRSREAATELSALAPLVSEHVGGPVRRVSMNIDAWNPDQPRRLTIGVGGMLRLGWFHTLDPATVTLGRSNDDRVTLLVLPPDMDPAAGRDLMRRLSGATIWPQNAAVALSGTWSGDGTEAAG